MLTLNITQAWHGYLVLCSPGTTFPFIRTNPKQSVPLVPILSQTARITAVHFTRRWEPLIKAS